MGDLQTGMVLWAVAELLFMLLAVVLLLLLLLLLWSAPPPPSSGNRWTIKSLGCCCCCWRWWWCCWRRWLLWWWATDASGETSTAKCCCCCCCCCCGWASWWLLMRWWPRCGAMELLLLLLLLTTLTVNRSSHMGKYSSQSQPPPAPPPMTKEDDESVDLLMPQISPPWWINQHKNWNNYFFSTAHLLLPSCFSSALPHVGRENGVEMGPSPFLTVFHTFFKKCNKIWHTKWIPGIKRKRKLSLPLCNLFRRRSSYSIYEWEKNKNKLRYWPQTDWRMASWRLVETQRPPGRPAEHVKLYQITNNNQNLKYRLSVRKNSFTEEKPNFNSDIFWKNFSAVDFPRP